MQNIQLSYPTYFLIYIVIIGLLYALSLYVNDNKLKETKSWLPTLLGLIRFLGIASILFMLLSPLLKSITTENEKPIILFLEDQSASLAAATDSEVLTQLSTDLDNLKAELAENNTVNTFYFGQNISAEPLDSSNTLSTNLSSALEFVGNNYEDQNLGSVILISDGIFNEGKNPLYSDLNLPVPIHSIALGDTTQKRDLLVKNVLHNRIVYLNDRFVIETDIQAYNANGTKTKVNLFEFRNGNKQLLDSKNISISGNKYFESLEFELEATRVGNIRYSIEVSGISNEESYVNNTRNVYLDVLDARQKILLYAASSHPDVKAIKDIVERNKNYEIDIAYAQNILPKRDGYDVIILHNLPDLNSTSMDYIQYWNQNKVPMLFIAGNGIKQSDFNTVQNVFTIEGQSFSLNNVTPVFNPGFTSFNTDEKLTNKLSSFVPLKAAFGEYSLNPSAQVLLYQRIGSVETNYPLLAYSDMNNHKQAVLAGEGIWRWKLMEYFESESFDITEELIQKSIQYISQKEDKRQFRVYTNKKDYRENESILLDAQLYNDNYELINGPEAELVISNEQGENFEYIFSKNQNYYIIDAGRFSEGNYSYRANTVYNGKKLTAKGSFTVQSIMKESFDLTARHDILFQLSNKFGGNMITPDEVSSLADQIASDDRVKTIMYQKASTKPLLDWPWFLGVIMLLLAIEWFLRRYYGAY